MFKARDMYTLWNTPLNDSSLHRGGRLRYDDEGSQRHAALRLMRRHGPEMGSHIIE